MCGCVLIHPSRAQYSAALAVATPFCHDRGRHANAGNATPEYDAARAAIAMKRTVLDGLCAVAKIAGKPVKMVYRITSAGYGPTSLTLNGTELPFQREANPYRSGGVEVSMAALSKLLTAGANRLQVQLQ
jgi:hypothetical protein